MIVLARHCRVGNVVDGVVTKAKGAVPDAERARDQQAKTVARLTAELGPDVRLVHGAADGLVGTFGSPQHMHYGPLLPGFGHHLGALLALEFGQSAEVPAT